MTTHIYLLIAFWFISAVLYVGMSLSHYQSISSFWNRAEYYEHLVCNAVIGLISGPIALVVHVLSTKHLGITFCMKK